MAAPDGSIVQYSPSVMIHGSWYEYIVANTLITVRFAVMMILNLENKQLV